MSVQTASSVEEAIRLIITCQQPNVCVVHEASSDVSTLACACAATWAKSGQRVRIVCADRWNAACMQTLASESDGVEICSVRDLALRVLDNERVSRELHRSNRLLDANEIDVLLEDVKVCGIAPRRLRKMLDFFFKGLADCAADDPYWLINQEEKKAFAVLCENLRARRAVLPEEASFRALEGLRNVPDAIEPAYTIALDYGAMSKSSQQLVLAASPNGITVFGRNRPQACPDEKYPYYEGLADFSSAEQTIAVALDSQHDPHIDGPHTFPNPQAEFSAVANDVAQSVESGVRPQDILIAVPNAIWAKMIGKELDRKKIAYTFFHDDEKVHGDPRRKESCGNLKLAAFAKLVANPHDIVALRTWIGCGDWLMYSDAFLEVLAFARDHGDCDVEQAIGMLREDSSDAKAFSKIEDPLNQLDQLRTSLARAKSVNDVREAFADANIALDERQLSLVKETDEGANIDELLSCSLPAPAVTQGDGVRIAPYAQCHSLFAPNLYFTGAVAGFIPPLDALDDGHTLDHKRRADDRAREQYADILARAGKRVWISLFEHDRLENTDSLGMHIDRVYVSDGKRMGRVVPCPYLEEMR